MRHSVFCFHLPDTDVVTWPHLTMRASAMPSLLASQVPRSEMGARKEIGLGLLPKGPLGPGVISSGATNQDLKNCLHLCFFPYLYAFGSLPGLSILCTCPFVM